MLLPFGILLLSIALGPLIFPKWWHHNYPKVSLGLGLFVALYYFYWRHDVERLLAVGEEYVSFILLIGSLFVVAGGIHIVVKGESRPRNNVIFLLVGALSANLIGTTGASMLLIRPWIRMNKYRITAFHIVFFIFIVSNLGGCLTPIGDPPLFLGFLHGVPFWWVLTHCWPMWVVGIGLLLAIFFVYDRRNFLKAPARVTEDLTAEETWRFQGLHNLFFLGVILAAVLGNRLLPHFVPEAMMLVAAALSFRTTPRFIHEANAFNFEPISEVAWLFVGIFATMIPALDYLGMHAAELGIHSALQFYFATGSLSAVLDNAPTYLTFLSAQMGLHGLDLTSRESVLQSVRNFPLEVAAISVGAVFFGAMTYIGNGPNLMVKSIAEHARVKTPHFFGYILWFSLPVLLPVLIVVGALFFSGWLR